MRSVFALIMALMTACCLPDYAKAVSQEELYTLVDRMRALARQDISQAQYLLSHEELRALLQGDNKQRKATALGESEFTLLERAFILGLEVGYMSGTLESVEEELGVAPGTIPMQLFIEAGEAMGRLFVAALKGAWDKETGKTAEDLHNQALLERVAKLEIREFRQYFIESEVAGRIMVVEGRMVNGFDTPRGFIQIEIELTDAEGTPLFTKTQTAGVRLNQFQLQIMNKEALEGALNDKKEIERAGGNVLPGEDIPFMMIFYDPDPKAAHFEVRIIDATIEDN